MSLSKNVRAKAHLKIEEKVKIIELYSEDSTLNFQKFTEKVNFRLPLNVSRPTVQRIIKDKVYRKTKNKYLYIKNLMKISHKAF